MLTWLSSSTLKVEKKAEQIAKKLAIKKGKIHLVSINDLLSFWWLPISDKNIKIDAILGADTIKKTPIGKTSNPFFVNNM